MAQITKRHRALIDRKLERIKQREGHGVLTRRKTTENIDKTTFHKILDKASQPIKRELESDLEQS